MEDTIGENHKAGRDGEDSLYSMSNDRDISGENGLNCSQAKSKRLKRKVSLHHSLVLKVRQLQRSKTCVEDSFLQSIRASDSWIPKHMVTVDEKYLRRCLELIHSSDSEAASCNISLNLGWGDTGALTDSLNPAKAWSESTHDLATFDLGCPLADETGSLVISPPGHWIVGSIMGSNSMMNILKSPLLRQHGAFDGDTNFREVSLTDVKGSICYDFMNSPGGFSNFSSNKPVKEATIRGNNKSGSATSHERLVSMSSTNSSCSDQSSSSISATVTQGMLQCTWKGGSPHFVFSLDDQKVVYVANLCKVESAFDKALDYTYLFHLQSGGRREHEFRDNVPQLIGKMKVSTSFTLCPDNSRIMEREFVLFGGMEHFMGEMQSHDLRKNKGLSKKVAEVFRATHSMKKRTTSRFGGSSAILENSCWEPFQDADNNVDVLAAANLLENNLPPNIELAAIVVKDHLPHSCQEKVGGWGLKFLKKVGVRQTSDAMESAGPFSCFPRDTSDCSTSMDILVPAGVHGGPRTRNSGPSSLIERWRSGGYCDCGGWDLGCPLTVLKSRPNNKEVSSQDDKQGECKLIDLYIQGSDNSTSPLRMVNVYDGLYFVHFQSTLSALQSFSIAVAFIHAQSPTLRPKTVHDLK